MLRNFQYAVKAVTYGEDAIAEEITRAHALWNRLLDIDQAEQNQLWDAARAALPELAEACQRRSALRDAYHAARDARRRARGTKTEDQAVRDAAVQAMRDFFAACKVARDLFLCWRKANRELVRAIQAQSRAAKVAARQTSRLYFGTYNDVMQRFEVAASQRYKHGRKPARLRRKEDHETDGTLTVQITGGGHPAAAMSSYAQCALAEDGTVRLRVGTVYYGEPMLRGQLVRYERYGARFATLKIAYHRPLPADGTVKLIRLTRRRGEYWLTFSVAQPEPAPRPMLARMVGININWRETTDGLRVAAVAAEREHAEMVVLPAEHQRRHARVAELEGEIDTLRDAVWEAHRAVNGLPIDVSYMLSVSSASYLDPDRLADRVLHALREDLSVPQSLIDWRKAHRRLRDEADGLRGRLARQRREAYRLAALRIVRAADAIGLEDIDLSQMALHESQPDGGQSDLHQRARRNRVIAAPHELMHWVRSTAEREGVEVHTVPAAYVSQTCSACGGAMGASAELYVTCPACAITHDRDANAAANVRERLIAIVHAKERSQGANGEAKQQGSRTSFRALHAQRAAADAGSRERSQPGAQTVE